MAGTSPSTVSRVLTGNAPVREDLRAAVLHAIEALGYRPNLVARSLKTRATHSLGLLINDILNPFYGAVAKGIEDRARAAGYTVMFFNTDEDPARELAALRLLRDKGVDGIILAPTGQNLRPLEELLAEGTAIIQIDRRVPSLAASAVTVDNEIGSYLATSHLIAQGHRRIGLVTSSLKLATLADREQGYRRALQEVGLPIQPGLIFRLGFGSIDGEKQLQQALAAPQAPTALLVANNRMALSVLRMLKALGLHIPGDVALVVFDDLEFFALHTPSITAVTQPAYEIGQKASELLLAQVRAEHAELPHVIVFQPSLVVRDSSGRNAESSPSPAHLRSQPATGT